MIGACIGVGRALAFISEVSFILFKKKNWKTFDPRVLVIFPEVPPHRSVGAVAAVTQCLWPGDAGLAIPYSNKVRFRLCKGDAWLYKKTKPVQ